MPRRVLEGKVVSAANNKTVTVLVERRVMHPVYKKYVRKSAKYAAHDENNTYKIGDAVSIIECRPISKSKRWSVLVDGVDSLSVADKARDVAKKAKPVAAPKDAKPAAPKAEKPAAEKKAPAKADKKPAAKKPAAKKDDKKK